MWYIYVALSDRGSMHVKISLPAIGGQRCIEMWFRKFSINPDISGHYGKLSELYFNVPLSSNCGEKVLSGIKILSQLEQHFNAI